MSPSTYKPADLVVYHGQCNDGFAAVWIYQLFHRYLGKDAVAECYSLQHGQEVSIPFRGKRVVFLDFCLPRTAMEKIADECESLVVLDHHQTAMEAMSGFDRPNTVCVFDLKRSGAGLSLDACDWVRRQWVPGKPGTEKDRTLYWPVSYVEDRDLWLHRLGQSREVNAFLSTLPYEFDAWTDALSLSRPEVVQKGEAVLAQVRQYVTEVSRNARAVTFEGLTIPCVNAPQVNISELLNFLCRESGVAMGWWQTADGRFKYSLRSKAGTIDVSRLAQRYGGGGHPNAAGFETDKPIHF